MKTVMTRKEMMNEGFPRRILDEISHNEDCTFLFFRTGTGKTSNIYYYPEQVKRWLEMREDERFAERKKRKKWSR